MAARHPVFTKACPSGMASLQAKTAVAVKGLVRDALRNSKYLVVVDHLTRPSQALAASIRELMLNWSVPVVAVSRSAHMEDVGFVLPLFPDRTEKFGVRNFDSEDCPSCLRSLVRKDRNWARTISRNFWIKSSNTAAGTLEPCSG